MAHSRQVKQILVRISSLRALAKQSSDLRNATLGHWIASLTLATTVFFLNLTTMGHGPTSLGTDPRPVGPWAQPTK